MVMGSFTGRKMLYSAALVLGVSFSMLNPSSPSLTEYECVQYQSSSDVQVFDLTADRTSVIIKSKHEPMLDGYGSYQRCWW